MSDFARKYLDRAKPFKIADVGSLDINGCYREIFTSPNWRYVGIDLVEGKNVDMVVPDPYEYSNIADESFDVVVSGQTLEHVRRPYRWFKELHRILKGGGLICIIVLWNWPKHERKEGYRDYWRVLEAGMEALLEDSGFKIISVEQGEFDTVGIATKP